MEENDKVIVKMPESQKIEVPFSIYFMMLLQIAAVLLVAYNVGTVADLITCIHYGLI